MISEVRIGWRKKEVVLVLVEIDVKVSYSLELRNLCYR